MAWLEEPLDVITNNVTEQLTLYKKSFYKLDFAELWGLNPDVTGVTGVGDVPLGMEVIESFQEEETGGMADPYDGVSDDVRTINVEIAPLGKHYIALFSKAVDWSVVEVERQATARKLNSNIPTINPLQKKIEKLGQFFNRRDHYTTLYGFPRKKIYGLFSQSEIATIDASFLPYKKAAGDYILDSMELYENLLELCFNFRDRARLSTITGITIRVPPRLYVRLVSPLYDGNANYLGTVKNMLMNPDLGLGISRIIDHAEVQGSNLSRYVPNDAGDGFLVPERDRIVFQVNDIEIERHFYPKRTLPIRPKGALSFQQVAISASTGVMLEDKNKMWYFDFSNELA